MILYADDTDILSESKEGMQRSLNIFQSYCDKWKLEVNASKTKVIVFSKRKCKDDFLFTLYGENLERVDTFSYVGIVIKYNDSFIETRKKMINQSQKA